MRWNVFAGAATALALLLVCLPQTCPAADGEGSYTLTPNQDWQAGSYTKFEVDYTAGPSGIAVGGYVAVTLHHALVDLDKFIQTTDPNKPGYVKVLCDTSDNLAVRYEPWGSVSIMSTEEDHGVYHRAVIARVLRAPIKPGEKIRFIYGACEQGVRVPTNTNDRNQIRIKTDADADGKVAMVKQIIMNNIVAGPVHHLFVTATATPIVGEKAAVLVRAEDEYNNLAEDYGTTLRVSGMPGCPTSEVALVNGLAKFDIPITKSGVFRVSVTDIPVTKAGMLHISVAGGDMNARSNPIVATAKAPKYRVYFGDIHGHTNLSDGMADTVEEYFAYGRDKAGLNVCANSEHGAFEDARIACKKFNEPGRFVTIYGYEWSCGIVDRNIYFRDEDCPMPEGYPSSTKVFWESLAKIYGDNKDHRIIVGPHMFTYKRTCVPWYEDWNPNYERFVEVYSNHGMSEYYGNPRMLAEGNVQKNFFMQSGLKYGRRFGIIGSGDNHDSYPGRGHLFQNGGLVAFLAKDLTRESVWDAWWNRRVYATSTERIYIDFKIDGHEMGEEFKTSAKPMISYTVYGCDDNFDVFLLKNCDVMKKSSTTNGEVKVDFLDKDFNGDSYYYLRVVQKDGEWAWSSPIWVDCADKD